MNNFKHTNDIYLYDGTIEGLFTLIYATYKSHTYPSKIYSEKEYIDNIIDTPIYIETNYEQSDIVKESIINKDSFYKESEIILSNALHRKAKINVNEKNKGTVTLEFFNKVELKAIVALLSKKEW